MLKLIVLSCLVACVLCRSYGGVRRDSSLFDGIGRNRWDTGLDRWGNDPWNGDIYGSDRYGRGSDMWRNRRDRDIIRRNRWGNERIY
ncbi:hypothetical protein KP79_PYT15356 [Mizuhopecten yessoensis]|uniref:Uncharacterized protein n=1 Tax=Mizuhopecten yessoensis TaxID=6573 RepID=A0A210QZ36_MIZYE|nr:hypothetical protein KP79_PYT15356 [Mizuhopecten yessoensis]